jgi:hypothetical protein
MEEVTLRIAFLSESLGAVRCSLDGEGDVFCMPRSPDGRVMYLPTWWASIARFAAVAVGKPAAVVNKIAWDPIVDGEPKRWRRYFASADGGSGRRRYAKHEAFRPGDNLAVRCVLPDGLSREEFGRIMEAAGRYRGISPFKPGHYGLFRVVGVSPCRASPDPEEPVGAESGPGRGGDDPLGPAV